MKTLAWPAALLICLSITSHRTVAQTGTYKLTINVTDFDQRIGTLRIGLVSKAENFLAKSEMDTAVTIPAQGPLTVTMPNLKSGTYAVQVYQDLNGNKKLDQEGGRPTEPFGFSNIAMLMGPPTFEQAAVEVGQDTAIRIRLLSL